MISRQNQFPLHPLTTRTLAAVLGLWLCGAVALAETVPMWSTDTPSQMDLLDNRQALKKSTRIEYSVLEDRERPVILFVDEKGELNLPLIGLVPAVGKTCLQLAKTIKPLLEERFYYRATVILKRQTSGSDRGKVDILGEVRSQGSFPIPLDESLTVSKAILKAGGFTESADKSKVSLIRKDPNDPDIEIKMVIDVGTILETGNFDDDEAITSGDLIIVPLNENVGGQVYVIGAVNSPGLLNIPPIGGLTVSKAILRSGGFTKFADKKKVKLIRGDAEIPEEERTIIINVTEILEQGNRDLDMEVKGDDIIRVKERWIVF